jgi:4-hydroxybenzoate polyprenyltransferase
MRWRTRRWLLRLEGTWWMMRVSIWMAIMVPAGSFAAAESPSPAKLLAAVLATVLAGGLAVVINDVLDREKDEVTAPELPLPSGVVTLSQALVFGGAVALCTIALWGLASTTLFGWVMALLASGGAGVLVVLYSFAKPYGLIGPVIGGLAYSTIPVAAWSAAGGGIGPYPIEIVIIYAVLIGTGGIIHAAIRDVDTDAEVGNQTVAVRLGAERALLLGTSFYLGSTICVAWAGVVSSHAAAGAVLSFATALTVVYAHLTAHRRMTGSITGRVMRVNAMRPATLSRLACHLALIAIVSPLLAAAIGAISLVVLPLQIAGYRARIYRGGLRKALEA